MDPQYIVTSKVSGEFGKFDSLKQAVAEARKLNTQLWDSYEQKQQIHLYEKESYRVVTEVV